MDKLRDLLVGNDPDLDDEQYLLIIDLDYGIIRVEDGTATDVNMYLPDKLVISMKQGLKQAIDTKDIDTADQRVCQVLYIVFRLFLSTSSVSVIGLESK